LEYGEPPLSEEDFYASTLLQREILNALVS